MAYFAGVCLKRFDVAMIHTGRREKLGVEISDEAVRLKRLYVTVDTASSKSVGSFDAEDSLETHSSKGNSLYDIRLQGADQPSKMIMLMSP